MKKIVFLILISNYIIFNNINLSQVVAEMETCNVLYRGHKTKFEIGFVGAEKNVSLRCSNAIVEKLGTNYFITAGTEKESLIEIIDVNSEAVLKVKKYYVEEFPVPSLITNQNIIYSHYLEPCIKNEILTILDWECTSMGLLFKGKGPILNDTIQRLISSGLDVKLVATVMNASGKRFTIVKQFEKKPVNVKKNFNGFISIIEKSEATKHIFDYDDPFSIVSLISTNYLTGYELLDSLCVKRIIAENPAVNFSKMRKNRYDEFSLPIAKIDTLGNKIYKMNNGVLVEDLYEPFEEYYDLKNIDKIIVFEDTLENLDGTKKLEIIKLGFAKKYQNSKKHDVIITLPYSFVREIDAFKTIVKLSKNEAHNLISDSNSFYYKINFLNKGKSNSLAFFKKKSDSLATINHTESVYNYYQTDFQDGIYFKRYPKYSNYFSENVIKSSIIPANFKFQTNNVEYISKNYQCETFDYQPRDYEGSPKQKIDSITGEPLIAIDPSTGVPTVLIEEIKRKISYIYNDNPNFYLQYDFVNKNDSENGSSNAFVESIFVTTNSTELKGELLTFRYNFYKKSEILGKRGVNLDFDPILNKYVIKNYTSTLPCFMELEKQLKKIKRLNVNKTKDKKIINESFNLDQLGNTPINLIGIQL